MHIFLLLLALFTLLVFPLKGQHTISGRVLAQSDSLNSGLPGVSVLVVGTERGTITDYNGDYKIEVSENGILNFSYVGFVDQQIPVGNKSIIDVMLQEDVKKLNEVVVTAMSIPREVRALSYSVTQVDGAEFTKARENNTADQLAGRVAGVNVSNMATGPAGASRVIIRGNKSLMGNNQPLYVIDGIPIDNTSHEQAGMWGGNDWGDGTTRLSPDDIESMTVLKGASASALYGSRASNGLILITTKTGTKQKGIGFEFNSNFVLEEAIDYYNVQRQYGHGTIGAKPIDAQEALSYGHFSWGDSLDGSLVPQFDGVERPYSYTGNNFNKFYETGKIFTNSLALTGGNDMQTYRLSMSHLKNLGVMPNSSYERLNLGLSLSGVYGGRKQFKVEGKVLYSHEDADKRPRVSDFPSNANYTIGVLPPSINVRDMRGDPDKPGAIYSGQNNPSEELKGYPLGSELLVGGHMWFQNPYWSAYQHEFNNTADDIIALVSLRYDFLEWLYCQVRTGMDWESAIWRSIIPYGTAWNRGGILDEGQADIREINSDWMLGIDKRFGESRFNGFIGGSIMRRYLDNQHSWGSTFNIPFFHVVSNLANQNISHSISKYGINSLYGSLEYNFKNFLFLTATGRNDWFSTLGPERNSIFYPSVGASWVFTDTFVFPSWWNVGKVRTSWAQVGGDTDPYRLDLTYKLYDPPEHGAIVLGEITQDIIPNSELVPLTSTEIEIGLDVRFLDNRLGLDAALYRQETTNDILKAEISEASGYGNAMINVGRMRNQGIELLLKATPLSGKLTWDLGFNIAYNENEILELAEGVDYLMAGNSRAWAAIQHKVGKSFGAIIGTRHQYDSIGKNYVYILQEIVENGDTLFSASPVQTQGTSILGYGVHPLTGGFTNTLSWKGWNLSFLVDFKFGGDIHSGTNSTLTSLGLHKQTLQGRNDKMTISGVTRQGEAFTETLSDKYIENYWNGHSGIHEYYIYDASFVKLRQLTFGYTFQRSLLGKTPFTLLDISFVGRNLALLYSNIENVDPESNYQNTNAQGLEYWGVPQTRTWGFNLRIGF